ncbi:ABC-F family ATP-binding cassette domain-containing protein [Corynebacterium lizhenjunii]|uniref:ABC-F family ATP-binding cassette domain-containing protein n=1 Tax=Corynebacterium lizhenjunii TaxID=2709394 RepID=A0A7T0KFG9_9CORY|nr:ABC-F family ATP-binding cassette domain-containing protein [Corynebacterium lizhenjunii]QPK79821.1 ABC-F family ATP-binding cassette domain-containing protein [Corynebacterium lizhenjunii]
MANLINLENVSKSFGLRTLLDGVSLGVQTGQRIGIVGVNGGGKTTLLEVLTGIEPPDSGRVSHAGDLRMAVVTQRFELEESLTIGQCVVEPLGVDVFEWASNAKIRDVLSGLGIVDLGLDTPVGQLSGGERRRVNLAAALVQDLDLVVLDEPTNHLDVEGVAWLAQHLLQRKLALVVVTHDRWFLDTVASVTWEVHDGRVDFYEGGYNDWIFARTERARQADAMEQRRQNLARKELAWLRRGAPARTSKPRYRIEAAEALIADVPAPRDKVELMAFSKQRQGRVVIELEDAQITSPDGRTLVDGLTWRLAPGERIGLVGVNGSGKTTLLRALAGEHPLAAGKRIEGRTVRLGWLRQELDDLDPTRTLLDSVEDVATYVQLGKKELSASQLAERLGFSPKRQRTPVGDLSGGERRRLQLTRVLMAEPNVLLLDEPTNDLDIDTLQELESLLDSWPGTLVVISHDRYLTERIADNTYALFGDGKLTHLPGGIEEYLTRRRAMESAPTALTVSNSADAARTADAASAADAADGKAQPKTQANAKAQAAKSSALSSQEQREITKKMNALERKMSKLDQATATLNEQMAQAAEKMDTAELVRLDSELKQLTSQREELEMEWLELGEKLEA